MTRIDEHSEPSARAVRNAWRRLAAVTALRFTARSASDSGWNGSGSGSVAVARPEAGALTFTEAGTWQPEGGPPIKFSNVFRWRLADGGRALRLSHLRFGPDRPVYLFDLVPEGDRTWTSRSPHVCRADRYAATMVLAADHIALRWTIEGPEKDEDLRYRYV